mgnify:CR=1 FL=1
MLYFVYFEDYLYDNSIDKAQKNNLIKSKEYKEIDSKIDSVIDETIDNMRRHYDK